MSGGRATVARKKGQSVRQAGDVCAVAPEGHALTDRWYVEVKHYRDLQVAQFVVRGTGRLAQFWRKAVAEARKHGKKSPVLVARQRGLPTMIVVPRDLDGVDGLCSPRVQVDFYDGAGGVALVYQLDEFLDWHLPPTYVFPEKKRKIERIRR